MKLKELLKVIPDNYRIGIMDSDPDNYSILVFGNEEDIVVAFAHRASMSPAHVKSLKVTAIHPGCTAYMPTGVDIYGGDSAELHIKTQLLIEVSTAEEEND